MFNREQIEKLIKTDSLVQGYIDLTVQLTPNGFDLTAAEIFEFDTQGSVDFSNKERVVPAGREIFPQKKKKDDAFGWWELKFGIYKVKTNEIVNIPASLIALAFTRTSLLRMGAFTQHGVWDAGYRGRSEFVLVVQNPFGVRIKQNARIAQLVFLDIQETAHLYQGAYQNTA